MTDRIWILGASDPEMAAIENLLRDAGERFIYALAANGERVRGGDAYGSRAEIPPEVRRVYLVECDVPTPDGVDRVVIDHHRPGDPGYGRPPAEFLAASSIGQVIAELARLGRLPWESVGCGSYEPTDAPRGEFRRWLNVDWYGTHDRSEWIRRTDVGHEWRVCVAAAGETGGDWGADPCDWCVVPLALVLAAAADHCLAAAYRGECPGVDPDELMRWRVESRAKFQGRLAEEMLASIDSAHAALLHAPVVNIGGKEVRDMRGQSVPELVEAGTRYGIPYIAAVDDHGRSKVVCSGTFEIVRAFLEEWAPPSVGSLDCMATQSADSRERISGIPPERHTSQTLSASSLREVADENCRQRNTI